ncbi:Uncharacterised protein [Mycobacteroides abscessus subsp. abscessus]|nr:Uncharacterised protein [Mycobacteroides abscessus subsp. abscessus]
MPPVAGDTAARTPIRHKLSQLAIEVRVQRVTEAKLDTRADLVLQRRPDLRPA